MNLPIVQHIKRTTKINVKDKRINNRVKKLNLLNYFLLPNNNISSFLHGKKNKIETDFRKTTQSTNNINNINQKINIPNKTKRLFFHNSNSNNPIDLNSTSFFLELPSSRIVQLSL